MRLADSAYFFCASRRPRTPERMSWHSCSLNCAEWRRYGPRDDMDLLLLKAQPAYQSDLPCRSSSRGSLHYGVNLSSLNVKVIVYLDKILKGAKPGDLPVERPSEFDFIVNQRTAREIGVTVSA